MPSLDANVGTCRYNKVGLLPSASWISRHSGRRMLLAVLCCQQKEYGLLRLVFPVLSYMLGLLKKEEKPIQLA